jgi:parvulin-like peptidyl-prolyl isomerase
MRLVPLFLALVVLTQCGKDDRDVLVKVGDQMMEEEVFIEIYYNNPLFNNSETITPKMVRTFLDDKIIPFMLFQAEGYERDLDEDSLVQERMDDIRRDILTRRSGTLYRSVIPDSFDITEQEIKDYYEKTDQAVKVAHIWVSSSTIADSIYEALQSGADFAKLAARYSMDVRSAKNGGKIPDWLSYGQFGNSTLDSVVFSLEAGELSRPLKTRSGYNIIKILDRQERQQRPLDEQNRRYIARQLERRKHNQFIENYMMNLFDSYDLQLEQEPGERVASQVRRTDTLAVEQFDSSLLDQTLITWDEGSWTVREFINEYHSAPPNQVPVIMYPENIKQFAQGTLLTEFLYRQALDKGFDDAEDFRQTFDYQADQIVGQRCQEKLVFSRIDLTEEEMEAFKEQHGGQMRGRSDHEIRVLAKNFMHSSEVDSLIGVVSRDLKSEFDIVYNEEVIQQVASKLTSQTRANQAVRERAQQEMEQKKRNQRTP